MAFAAILDQSQPLAKPGRPPFACPLATDAILMMEVGEYSSHPFCFFWSRIFHFVISAECDAGSSFAVALRFISATSYGSALSLISVPVARIFNSKISDFLKK